jgi:CubicO group peptidase (beta-lactamase class C family)
LLRKNLRLLPVLAFILLGLAALTATRQAEAREKKVVTLAPSDAGIVKQIHHYRRATWHWQSVMGAPRSRAAKAEKDPSRKFKLWVRNLWKHRATHARRVAVHPPHKAEWLCIHRYEGGWTSATGNGYYGGLQMDISFMRTYGPRLLRKKGTANNWTPLEQMWVAERAHRSGRGFYPWPNTARACGLI